MLAINYLVYYIRVFEVYRYLYIPIQNLNNFCFKCLSKIFKILFKSIKKTCLYNTDPL